MSVLADSALKRGLARGGAESSAARGAPCCDQHSAARLVSFVVGDAESILKCASRTARLLEEQFIIDGWPVGRIYGSEVELAERYGVGNAVVRETARILEVRGTARMRRGRYGGLELTAPSAESLQGMIGSYCYLIGVSNDHVRSARTVLDRVAAYMATERGAHLEFAPLLNQNVLDTPALGRNLRRLLTAAAGNAVVTLYSDCLDYLRHLELPEESAGAEAQARCGTLSKCIDRLVIAITRGDARSAAAWAGACSQRIDEDPRSHPDLHPQGRSPGATNRPSVHAREVLRRTRAGQIVYDMMKRVGPGDWQDGRALGNELELCEQYRVDRGVLRQAIRILEAAETAASLPGRGRGLVARTPGPAATSRLICSHFAANRVGHYESFQMFECLGVEMIALAAREPTYKRSLEPTRAALDALGKRSDTVLLSELIDIEEHQFALARNPVLDLFLRSAKAFPSWLMQGNLNLPVSSQVLRDFLECSADVNAAIVSGNPVAAAGAQRRKVARLRQNHDYFFANFRTGLFSASPARVAAP